jgi:hypothetical protein
MLAWSVGENASADVAGPAEVRAGGSDDLVLVRGAARVEASGRAIVTALARTSSASGASTWQVQALADRTHVAVIAGGVSVEALAGARDRAVVRAGESLDVLANGSIARAPRATFVLAELELARGDLASARPRLVALAAGPDPSLAEDAALLLARSYPAGRARAEVWRSILASSPGRELRARARVERATELLGAGDADDARAVIADLKREDAPLADPLAQRLHALEARLVTYP